MAEDTPLRRSRWGKRLLALALSTLFALIAAELGLRAYFWTKGIGRSDIREVLERSRLAEPPELHGGGGLFGRMEPSPFPDVVYQLKPHLKGTLRGALIETNRFGMRGPEIKKEKPANTYRLVGIGDSHMFGWAVAQGEEYMRLLETKLNAHAEPGWKFETLNFGTPGYNTVMEVGTFEHRALEFEPDFVLLHFVGNDILAPHFLKPPPGLAPSSWYLVELVKGLVGTRQQGTSALDAAEDDDEADEPEAADDGSTRAGRRSEYAHLGGHGPFKEAMARLAELTHAKDIPVLQLQLGVGSEIHRWARDQGQALGFDFLDLQPSLDAKAHEMGIELGSRNFRHTFVRDEHPAPPAHEAYARSLFCELERMKLPHLRPAPEECSWESAPAPAVAPAPSPGG